MDFLETEQLFADLSDELEKAHQHYILNQGAAAAAKLLDIRFRASKLFDLVYDEHRVSIERGIALPTQAKLPLPLNQLHEVRNYRRRNQR